MTDKQVESPKVVSIKKKWKQPPTLTQIKADLEKVVIHNQKHINDIDRWLDLLYVRGSVKRKKIKGRSNVQPKLIRKQVEWRIPTLTDPFLSTDDLFNVYPKTFEDTYAAEQNQLVLNYQFNTVIDKVPFIDTYVRTFATEGTVFLRVGWHYREEEVEEEFPVYDYRYATQEDLFVMQQALMTQQEDKGKYISLVPENVKHSLKVSQEQGKPVFAEKVDTELRKVTKVVANHPTLDIVDYRCLFVDPNCKGNLEEAAFVVYSFDTSYDELKKMGKYENLDKVNISVVEAASLSDAQISNGINFNFDDDARKRITAYEYWGNWDIHGTGETVPIVMTWVGDTVIQLEENPYPDKKHPFVNTVYIPKKDSIYGETDAELLEDNQAIYGATMRSMIDILGRTANGQRGVRQDLLDGVNKLKYERGEHFEFNPSVDPRQGIVNFVSPEIPQSAQFMLQLQSNEAEALSGVKAYSGGISGEALGDVAAGIKGALDATSKRDLSILRRLSYGLIKAARKIMALNAVFLEEEEIVRITEDKFVNVRRDDLQGNFDLSLSISTAEEDNNQANKMAFMLQTIGNTVPFDLTKIVLTKIARLHRLPDLAEQLEAYQPKPDPLEQLKKELEIELLRARIEEARANAYQKSQTGNLKGAEVENVKADSNKKALDFVEQEKGVTHMRELEQQEAQAQGNMKYELLKHALERSKQESERVKPQDTGVNNE